MKLVVLQTNLANAVSKTAKITSLKSQLPILANLLLLAKDNKLIITGTNLEISLSIEVPAKIEKEGGITISGKTFNELISSIKSDKLELTTEKDTLRIKYGVGNCQLKGCGIEEFPPIPEFDKQGGEWQIKAGDFVALCRGVLFAASVDDSRPALSGVRTMLGEKEIELVATDGYRLSRKNSRWTASKQAVVLVPAKALLELIRLAEEKEQEAKFFLDKNKNQLVFVLSGTVLSVRLIEAEFPLFDKILPKSWQTEVFVDREELISALKTTAIFARESANIVKFSVKEEKMLLSANAALVGENTTEVEVKTTGPAIEIAFNFRFVLDFLNSLEEEQVVLRLGDSLSPAIFQPKNDPSLLHVIMPVRIEG